MSEYPLVGLRTATPDFKVPESGDTGRIYGDLLIDGAQTVEGSATFNGVVTFNSTVNINGTNDPRVTNPRALSQAIHMTSASSGSNGIRFPHSTVYDLADTDFSLSFIVAQADYTPGSATWIYYKYEDADNYWGLRINTDGTLQFIAVVGGVTILSITSTAAISADDGTMIQGVFTCSRESSGAAGSGAFFVNGAQLGDAVAITAGTPASISNTGPLYINGTNAVRNESITQGIHPYNRTLTAADVLDLYLNGVAFADKWGSQTAKYASDFSAGTDGWLSPNGGTAISGNNDAIDGEDNWLMLSRAAGLNRMRARKVMPDAVTGKKKFRVSGKIHNQITAANVAYFAIYSEGANTPIGASVVNIAVGSTGTFSVVMELTNGNLEVAPSNSTGTDTVNGNTGDKWYLKDVVATQLGCTLDLEPEGINSSLQCQDSSGNKLHGVLPPDGASLVRPKKEFEIRWTNTWAGTHEAQYIGGVNQDILPKNAYIESIVGTVTGDTIEDIIIGDGSDDDRFVEITTGLAAGTTSFTLANRTDDGTNRKLVVDPDANFTGSIAFVVRGYTLEG